MSSKRKDNKRTPRKSEGLDTRDRPTSRGTPYNALHQLANSSRHPTTPGSRYGGFTPRTATRRTPRDAPGSAAPTTPHALRAMQRRAATPGRDRRKSGRVRRETPIDILRNLGKALAPSSKPIRSSPHEEPEPEPVDDTDALDQEPDIPRPRLSLPLRDMIPEEDEGSPDMKPPRMSLAFDEEELTQRSMEFAMRDRSEKDMTMLSRHSLGRLSDRFGELSRLDAFSEDEGETIMHDDDGNEPLGSGSDQELFDTGGETEDLRRFNLDFDFPTPDQAGTMNLGDAIGNEDEDFALDPIEPGPPSVSSDGAAGGMGIELNDRVSEKSATPSGLPEPLRARSRKEKKISRHGIPVPNLPSGIVKKLAARFARTGSKGKTKISKDVLAAVEQASEWFFEQASDDLGTYSKHAGRKTIDDTDVMTLMRR
ncbi:hypothetical protein FQN54_004461 [Arachnomyces sp. PD_36]|nr:hypothetical protein FQN54_004461 [Arachnomyces sp. PD_36]